MSDKGNRLFIFLGGFFITNALVAEFIGVKIFALEGTLGMNPLNWNLFGHEGSLSLTAGVMLWPVVFIMTDIINEYYGKKGVKMLSYLAVVLIAYAFLMVFGAIGLEPADWWVGSLQEKGIDNYQNSYAAVFGQSLWIIVGSLVAFLVGQVLDVTVFHWLRRVTGTSKLWLRATGSTLVSQLVDSFVVLYIAFGLGPQEWELSRILAVGTVNYSYKAIVAILLTPSLYLVHWGIDTYLGKELAHKMMEKAAQDSA